MGRKLKGLHLLLLFMSTASSAVWADYRRMAIDPSPNSPTLSDLLDRNGSAPARPAAKPTAKPRPAAPIQPAAHGPVSEPAPATLRSPVMPPALRPGASPVTLAPAQPVRTRAGKPHSPKSPEAVAPVQPQDMPAPPVARPAAHPLQGPTPVSARKPQPLTTLAVKRHEVAADPIMTGTTVPSGPDGEIAKSAPADMAQPLPATLAREAGKTSEPPKLSAPAPAATTTDSGRFVYIVDQDLRSFLTDFARRVGLRSEIAATVRGQITKVKLPAEPTALLKEIEKRHEIEWIIDGETLKVSSRGELATRILPLGKISYEELLRELKQVGVDTARYPLQPIGGSNAVILTAPAAHVARIAALVEALKAGKTTGPDIRIIRSGMTSKVNWE